MNYNNVKNMSESLCVKHEADFLRNKQLAFVYFPFILELLLEKCLNAGGMRVIFWEYLNWRQRYLQNSMRLLRIQKCVFLYQVCLMALIFCNSRYGFSLKMLPAIFRSRKGGFLSLCRILAYSYLPCCHSKATFTVFVAPFDFIHRGL